MVTMKKMPVNGKMYDVIPLEEYVKNKDLYLSSNTLIESTSTDVSILYPIINQYERSYGIKVSAGSAFSYISEPDSEQAKVYDPTQVIDVSQAKTIGELMATQDAIRDIEREILTSPDNITKPEVSKDDEPAMKALKEAVLLKSIDIHKYEGRFGSNFNNDIRNLYKNRISLQMLERMCSNLDIKATLTLSDASSSVPNPMGEEITIELTHGGEP